MWVTYSVGNSTGKRNPSVAWVSQHTQATADTSRPPLSGKEPAPPRSHAGSSPLWGSSLWKRGASHFVSWVLSPSPPLRGPWGCGLCPSCSGLCPRGLERAGHKEPAGSTAEAGVPCVAEAASGRGVPWAWLTCVCVQAATSPRSEWTSRFGPWRSTGRK